MKHIYFLSDGSEVADARMMTIDEARGHQAIEDAKGSGLLWFGPFTVNGPHVSQPWTIKPAP